MAIVTTEQWNWDFIMNVLVIVIPIIIGGIVTKYTTSSWQITKEKIMIKRNILENYGKSYKLISILLENFVYKVTESYIVYEESSDTIPFEDYSNVDHEISAYIQYPKEESEKPHKKFASEYEGLNKKLEEPSIIQNKFLSDVRLYYADKEIEDNIHKLEKDLTDTEDIILRLQFSKDGNELKKYYKIFMEVNKNATDKMKELENKMVELKFREINL